MLKLEKVSGVVTVVTLSSGPEWGASFESASSNAMTIYDEIMVPRLFDPWAELFLDELDPQAGQALLDIACGPGTVARQAALRVGLSGRVTGCDLSPAMLEIARSKRSIESSAPIDYLHCPADSLSVPDQDFDFVTCQQGLQFFPNRPAALAEMHRALRPGGKLGISVWCDIELCPPFAALATALRQVVGTKIAETYSSGPWGFSDSDSLVRLVMDAGFTSVKVHRYEIPLIFEGGSDQLLLTLHSTTVADTLARLSAADRTALAKAAQDATGPITFDGVIRSYATSNILTATRSEN